MNITILLVDDHEAVRESLRSLLNSQDCMEVIAEATDGQQAVRLAGQVKADVIIMDIDMPVMGGIEALGHMVADNPASRVLILSMHSGAAVVDSVLRAGAKGYVPKTRVVEELVMAVRAVAAGETYVSGDSS